ncbi:MAG: GntR family transcriptional regulator [Myxococcota bacterium]
MSSIRTKSSVTDRLRQDILDGTLAQGMRLVELQLTDRYGVGRAAVRSAIVELAKEGLVVRETNRGATVRTITVDEAIEVYEARAALEGLMARHAAHEATELEREDLRALVPGMREAVETREATRFASLGRELHERVSHISRHRVARGLVATLRNQSRGHPDRLSAIPERPQQSLAEHIAIIEAICSGDGDDAQRAVERHIQSIISALRGDDD